MSRVDLHAMLVALVMLAAAGLAVAMKPGERLADQGERIDLERMIPTAFAGWQIDPRVVPVVPSAEVQARLDELYNQTLARTYVNARGERVMLSIAYGGDQSNDATQVHRPEFCYTAQGFKLLASAAGVISTQYGSIPARRLLAVAGLRSEPIIYWITIGDRATLPGWERKLTQLRYGLTGKVPDGMLVRVSSIGKQTDREYELQEGFVRDMLAALDDAQRVRLTGALGS